MIALALLVIALVAAQQQCAAPFAECTAMCNARMDMIATCMSTAQNGVCTPVIKCRCDDLLPRCTQKCGMAGVEKCSCSMGKDDIVCQGDDAGLDSGAIAGIAIACTLIYCILCGVGLYFVWKNLPDADEDDETNNDNYRGSEMRQSSAPPPKPAHKTRNSTAVSDSSARHTYSNNGGGGGGGGQAQLPTASYSTQAMPQRSKADVLADQALDDVLNAATDDAPAGRYGYSARPPAKAVRSEYNTPQTMASAVDDEYFMSFDDNAGNGDKFYGQLPPSAADKKKAAVEAARKRAAEAVANRGNSANLSSSNNNSSSNNADEDLKRRRAEILRKKKEELLRKKQEAERQQQQQQQEEEGGAYTDPNNW